MAHKTYWDYIEYLNFKMSCAAEQEGLMWRLDYDKAVTHLRELEGQQKDKVEELQSVMPKRKLYKKVNKPKVTHKKDQTLSAHGERWFKLLREHKKPMTFCDTLTVENGEEEPNPNSDTQIKDWLFSLGWEPRTFKFVRDDNGERKIPQVRKNGELCASVRMLAEENPAVKVLDGLTVINHRISIFKSFVENAIKVGDQFFVRAEIGGLTNTLRFKHRKPLVNLPGVDAPWGKEIRGCLIASDEDHVLCGADMSSLTTKRHYMFFFDPDYVKEMSVEGFDEHLDLAKHHGVITQDDIDKHVSGERDLTSLRKKYKATNYSATYGIGAFNLSMDLNIPIKEAGALLEAYWQRNNAITKVVKNLKVRTFDGEMWLLNPVSGFWYALRYEKDKFSTLNQGTGVFCFDTWTRECRNLGERFIGQFHDEHINNIPKGKEEETEENYNLALEKANKELKLNVPLGMEAKFGRTYADIH